MIAMIARIVALFICCASSAFAQTIVTAPTQPQPSTSDDIVAFTVVNNTGSTWTGGKEVRLGHPIKDLDITLGQSLSARSCSNAGCTTGTVVAVGYNCQASHPTDSSCLLADLAVNTQATLANGASQAFMLVRCGGTGQVACAAAPSPAPPSAATVAALSDLATPTFATNASGGFAETDHCTGNGGTNILAAANTGGTTVTRFSNVMFNEYIARGTANSGALNITCVIDAFQDGTTITDVIIDNNWYATGGKSDQVYNFSMGIPGGASAVSYHAASGSCSNAFVTGNTHYLYGMWHCKVYGSGQVQPTIQYDVPYFEATKVVLPYDYTYGIRLTSGYSTKPFAIQDIANNLSSAPAGSGALGVTIFDPAWAAGGGSLPEIAQDPAQILQWLISQDPTAFKNMLILSEASGSIPWHVRSETTNAPLDGTVNTLQWDCDHGMSGGDAPANGCPNWASSPPTPSSNGTFWGSVCCSGDGLNHNYDQVFMSYITTLDYFQQQLFEYQYAGVVIGVFNRQAQQFSGTQIQCAEHNGTALRGGAWCLRDVIRAALWGPDSDGTQTSNPKTVARSVLSQSMATFVRLFQYASGSSGEAFGLGQLEGQILAYNQSFGKGAIFMTSYMLTSLYTLASMNYPPYSGQAQALMGYSLPIDSGLETSGSAGFPTSAGSVFALYMCNFYSGGNGTNVCFVEGLTPNGGGTPNSVAFSTWYQNYEISALNDQVQGFIHYPLTWGFGQCSGTFDPTHCTGGSANSSVSDFNGGYAIHAVNENALIWNITQIPQALEAWAISWAQTFEGMVGANPSMTQTFQVSIAYDPMPLMPDGVYQKSSHQVTDSTAGTASITCSSADSLLVSSGTGTKTFTGCNGGYDVMVGGYSANNYTPGTTGSFMFARYNVTGIQTFTSEPGNHVMYGCGSCASGGSDVFNFGSTATSGNDIVENFSTIHDTLGVHTNGSNCTSAATVVTNCMTTTGQDTTMTINGKTVVFKGIRDKNALVGLISMI